jgi:hypothetical protein
MDRFIRKFVNVDIEKTLYITRNEIGKEIPAVLNNKQYKIKIPPNVRNTVTLKLDKLGKKQFGVTGDLFLHIWVNQGEDIFKNIWVSDTLAKKGTEIVLQLKYEKIKLTIPQNSRNGMTIKLTGLGEKPMINIEKPPPKITRGDLYLLLFTYPEHIFSTYGSFDNLSDEAMALEGWIYNHIDDIKLKLRSKLPWKKEMKAEYVVSEFNCFGYKGIFNYLREYLDLQRIIMNIEQSDSMREPGRCETRIMTQGGMTINSSHKIFINKALADDPFTSAAILSHELCHIVYSEYIGGRNVGNTTSQMDIERSVDLLVFLFNLGEFQLRVARDMRLSLGYFNQENFERMMTIIQRRGSS